MNNLFDIVNSMNQATGHINSNIKDLKGASGKNLMVNTPATREELDEIAERFGAGSHMLVQFAIQYGAMVAYEESLEKLKECRDEVIEYYNSLQQ